MIRLSKLTDYGTVVLGALAARFAENPHDLMSAPELSKVTHIPLATVSKLLKSLSKAELICAKRGSTGGYVLAHAAQDISAIDILNALEGPIGLTQCASEAGACELLDHCGVSHTWQTINQAMLYTLNKVTLADMVGSQVALMQKIMPQHTPREHLDS